MTKKMRSRQYEKIKMFIRYIVGAGEWQRTHRGNVEEGRLQVADQRAAQSISTLNQ